MKTEKLKWSIGWVLACLFLVVAPAAVASPGPAEHGFTGTVTKLTPAEIELRNGTDTLQFARPPSAPGTKDDLHVGDRVTVYTNLEARRIRKGPKQEAGEKGHEVLDDRAFYSASD